MWKRPLNEVETKAIRLPSGEKRGSRLTAPPGRELPGMFCLQIQGPEFNRVLGIGRVHHPASVGRAIGLVVIARPGGQLLRDRGVELLLPQRSRHRVHHAAGIRSPRHRAGPGRELRQIHFAEVIRMRHVDLLEHGLALGLQMRGCDSQQEQQTNPVSLGQGLLRVSVIAHYRGTTGKIMREARRRSV